jgi:hypothetical protein
MFTKTLISVALIVVAISSTASAATVKRPAPNAQPAVHGTWDAYGLRYDSGTE